MLHHCKVGSGPLAVLMWRSTGGFRGGANAKRGRVDVYERCNAGEAVEDLQIRHRGKSWPPTQTEAYANVKTHAQFILLETSCKRMHRKHKSKELP